ncbi:MAG: glycosyltransferase family 2 protein [Candidatus Binatia bacterium]
MRLSIIIPTCNRARSLMRLLRSLEALEHPNSSQVEVLVVDNGSSDETGGLLLQEQGRRRKFSLRVLQEKQRGKASALNLALSSAKGDILFGVDDDVVVHPQWLVKHFECYRTTNFGGVQGRVLPGVDPEGRPADQKRLREYNIPIVDYGEEIREIRGLTGTNMSFKREVFEKVGFFDTRLGPGASGFSEDTEYSIRIRKAGFKIGYTPYAIVYHELDPARYGRAYNRMVQYRKGLSRSIYRRDSIAFNVLPNLVANCIRFSLYKALRRSQKAYKTEGRIMKYLGYLAGRWQRKMGKEP